MDVASFLAGRFLTQVDLSQPVQVWTIAGVDQRLVGDDQKVCITFTEFPHKPLGLNKTNLGRIAELYSTMAATWQGKQLLVYRSTAEYCGNNILCLRVCGHTQTPTDPICDQQGNLVSYQAPPVQQPAVPPPGSAPGSAPVQQPPPGWPQQDNSPPAA